MPRKLNPPSARCNATAQTSGERCRRYARPGRTSCVMHGAYSGPAGRAVMEERADAEVTLATLLATSPGRPVWEVIRDAVANVDALAQDAKLRVVAGDSGKDAMDRLAEMSRLAHSLAASAVATKALDMAAQIPDQWGNAVVARIVVLLGDWLGVPHGRITDEAVLATLHEFDPGNPSPIPRPDGPPLWALVSHAQAAALGPRLGLSSASLAAWFGAVADAVANGRPAPALPGGAVAALPPAPEPEPGPSPDVDAEPSTLQSAGSDVAPAQEPEPEPEIVDAELVDEEPEPEEYQRPRIFDPALGVMVRNPRYVRRTKTTSGGTTALGYQGSREPVMPTSRLGY